MATCGVKVDKIQPFWKHWTKSDHKQWTQSHTQNMWKSVPS